MTKQEFIVQIDRLIDVYGERQYAEARTEIIWIWARNLDGALFREAISLVISENVQTPLLPKIQEAVNRMRVKIGAPKLECAHCDGGGWYIPKDSPPLPTAYRCRCSAGDLLPKYVQKWSGDLYKYVPTKAELNWRESVKAVKVVKDVFENK